MEGESRVYFRSSRIKSPGQYNNRIPERIQMSFYFILRKRCDCASSGPLQYFQQHELFVLKTRVGKTWNISLQHESWEETRAGWAAQENNTVFDGFCTSAGVVAWIPSRIYAFVARKTLRNQI